VAAVELARLAETDVYRHLAHQERMREMEEQELFLQSLDLPFNMLVEEVVGFMVHQPESRPLLAAVAAAVMETAKMLLELIFRQLTERQTPAVVVVELGAIITIPPLVKEVVVQA